MRFFYIVDSLVDNDEKVASSKNIQGSRLKYKIGPQCVLGSYA